MSLSMFIAYMIKRTSEDMVEAVTVAACGRIFAKMIDVFGDKGRLESGDAHGLLKEVQGEYEEARIALAEVLHHLDDSDESLNLVSKAFAELSKFTIGLEQYVLFVSEGRTGCSMCDWIIRLMKQRIGVDQMMSSISRSFMDNLFINSEFVNKDDIFMLLKYLNIIAENITDEELDAI